jgi:ABC-2 type transport system permease protein
MGNALRSLRFLLRKEFLQIRRDRVILGMVLVVPVVQLLLLANAATFEVKRARVHIVDHDRTTASRGAAERLVASGRFIRVGGAGSAGDADAAMQRRETEMILTIPAGFERDLVRARTAPVQLVLNAEDGAAAGVSQSYATRILAAYAAELTPGTPRGPRRGVPDVQISRRAWYNPELDYQAYMIPGILVVLVTIVGTLLTAVNIVREKESGTLDQLNVTPITSGVFIAAKLIPLWSLALLDLGVGLALARLVFGIPMEGSLLLVFAAAAVYLIGALGIGLWISTVVETQQQAMFVSYSIMLVYLLMSGLFTPVSGMPTWAQWIAELSPVMHFTELMRAVLLKGAGPADVARPLLMLALIGTAVLTIAVRQYHKRAA